MATIDEEIRQLSRSVGNSIRDQVDIKEQAERFVAILRSEIAGIKSETTGEAFLDYINIDGSVQTDIKGGVEEISIGISFDEAEVSRESLWWQNPQYEWGAYMPVLVNNGYHAGNRVYGYDRHGEHIVSAQDRAADGFAQRAVDAFNSTAPPGVTVEANANYNGGTFDDGYKYY